MKYEWEILNMLAYPSFGGHANVIHSVTLNLIVVAEGRDPIVIDRFETLLTPPTSAATFTGAEAITKDVVIQWVRESIGEPAFRQKIARAEAAILDLSGVSAQYVEVMPWESADPLAVLAASPKMDTLIPTVVV